MKNKKGYLLPMALIFTVITLIIGFSIYLIGYYEQLASLRRLDREKAFYLAEAGLWRAYAHLKLDDEWQPESALLPLDAGSYQVLRDDTQSPTIILVATGSFGGRQEQIEMRLFPSGGVASSFGQGFFGRSSVTLALDGVVDSYDSRLGHSQGRNQAEVGTNGWMTLLLWSHINGTAYLEDGSDHLFDGWTSTIDHTVFNHSFDSPLNDLGANPVVIPAALTSAAYPVKGNPAIVGTSSHYSLVNGVLSINSNRTVTITGGDFRFKSIIINDRAHLNVTGDTRLYIENSLTTHDDSTLTYSSGADGVMYLGNNCNFVLADDSRIENQSGDPANLRVYTNSDHTFAFVNDVQALDALIYAPNATVLVGVNAQFYGGIIADDLGIGLNGTVYFDVNLKNAVIPDDPGGGGGGGGAATLTVTKWRKVNWSNNF